jgi:uncharacterized BrkB/YihY/UPF0761 family membrane protein
VIYFKSLLCGFVAAILSVLAMGVFIIIMLAIKSRNLPAGEAVGWDPISFFRNSLLSWIVLVAAFVIGFAWEYRHALPRR